MNIISHINKSFSNCWKNNIQIRNKRVIAIFFIDCNLIPWLSFVIIFYWKYLQHITLIFSRTSVDVHSGCPWFFAWNSSNYRENKFDIRSTKLPPIKIFSQLTQAFLEILKSRIWSIRAATIIECIWLCTLLFYHWVQWFNLQDLFIRLEIYFSKTLH